MNKLLLKISITVILFFTLGGFISQKIYANETRIMLGIDYLEKSNFSVLKDKRIGLLTHPAGRNSKGKSTVDVFVESSNVNLVALFGPEHGIYGDEKASVPVDDRIDDKTGLPVFSLTGNLESQPLKCSAKLMH